MRLILAHRSQSELIGWDSSRRTWVPVSFRLPTLSNITISKTSWPIKIEFYLKHHCNGGKATIGFGPDQIRTLVSMVTDSSHRVIIGK